MIRAISVWLARIAFLSITFAILASTLLDFWPNYQQVMFRYTDKIAHFLSTLFLTMAALLAFPRVYARQIFAGAIIIAALVELVQLFGPRTADLVDFGASTAGVVAVAAVFYSALLRKRQTEDGHDHVNQQNHPQ
ncbi:MAG: hypothetical protein AAF437_11465 [Pseudomonadota bacterium]